MAALKQVRDYNSLSKKRINGYENVTGWGGRKTGMNKAATLKSLQLKVTSIHTVLPSAGSVWRRTRPICRNRGIRRRSVCLIT